MASRGPLAEDLPAVALALVFGVGLIAIGWSPPGGFGGSGSGGPSAIVGERDEEIEEVGGFEKLVEGLEMLRIMSWQTRNCAAAVTPWGHVT